MEQASPSNGDSAPATNKLESQLREMYGRAAYTHKTHEKMADGYIARYKTIKNIEILASVLASSSLLLAIFADSRPATVFGAFFSAVVLGLTLYFKEASLGEQAQKHTVVASKLWGIREKLLSLLVDMREGMPAEVVREKRDQINDTLEEIYKAAPRTDAFAYTAAQQALKNAEELFFADKELDKLLPKHLRHS
jgi:hypothetical protein